METVYTLRRCGLVALLCLGIVAGSLGAALAKQSVAVTATPKQGSQASSIQGKAYDAILLCNPGIAEDSAAHVRLVQFEHAPEGWVIVYRCKHNGY